MSKSDTPPFRMIVEKGPRLAPATAGDAERLDTWRAGSQVNVTFVRDGSRPMERKWWAILDLVVDRCNVPWSAKEQASEAVKLSLGIVHYGKTVNGNFMQWPKSLTELSDPELDEAVRDMMDLLHRMTGVDPETLKKEAKVEDEHSSPAESPSGDGSASASPSSPGAGAADNSPATAEEAGSQDMGERESEPVSSEDEAAANFRRTLMGECIDNLLRDATSEPKDKRLEKIEKAASVWRQELPDHVAFVDKCADTARRIADSPADKEKAREYLSAKVA